MPSDISKFYVVDEDYPRLAYFASDADEGDHVMFVAAGTSLLSLVRAAEKYTEEKVSDRG